jgi:CRISPR-associated endonuclease Cas2
MKKITKIKMRYYSKEILKYLLLAGMIYIAASSPYFVFQVMRNLPKFKKSKKEKKKFLNAFYYLKKRGLIEIKKEGHDICIALTPEGKKQAGKYQIDDLEIKKPKKWDKKWRVIIFDISDSHKIKRNALRRKLKELGFFPLQRSVWVFPFDCEAEINLLREFFGLNKKEVQLLLVTKIENELFLKKFFKL